MDSSDGLKRDRHARETQIPCGNDKEKGDTPGQRSWGLAAGVFALFGEDEHAEPYISAGRSGRHHEMKITRVYTAKSEVKMMIRDEIRRLEKNA